MIPITLADVCRATGGRLADGARAEARVTAPVVIDSRRCEPGGLFVCVKGDRYDGHAFARDAVEAGAGAVMAARPVGVPAVVVDDTANALGVLATAVLALAPRCRVVAVTGSSGKTSTKDLLAQVFERAGETVSPEGSFNNEIGLPLTVLRITESTRTLVCEYSARGVGHIRYLCGIAPPSIAVVLNVGDAHLGEFGSRQAIARSKAELVEALPEDGVAVLNADDPLVAAMRDRTAAPVVTFGCGDEADVRVVDLRLDELARPRFRLLTASGDAQVSLRLLGEHQAWNAAAVAAAATAAGIPLGDVAEVLSQAVPRSGHRMQLHERGDGLVVIDDAYNANPASMKAAVDALMRIGGRRAGCTWAVLGEMRELGAESRSLHSDVGAVAARLGVDEIVAVGAAVAIAEGATATPGWDGRARTVPDVAAATALLRAEVSPSDVVLVKASNAVELWQVAEALLPRPARADDRAGARG